MSHYLKLIVILVATVFFLAACGGGGGGSDAPAPPPPAPVDTDNDGTPDVDDTDDDGDGVADDDDAFPKDDKETRDFDGDGVGDNADTDDDGDGVEDANDAFPLNKDESVDTDGDGTGNNADTDDDNDGVADTDDDLPLDANESVDTDGDGIGNNADTDDDNDGVADTDDDLPLDANESVDTDGDGIGNNADTDDDGDGVADASDPFPLDGSETLDSDGDGTGNNADTDDDNDGVADANDDFPLNPARTMPIKPLFPKDANGRFVLPDTPAANQLNWIIEQLAASSTSLDDINDRFDPATLAGTPATTWQTFFDTLRGVVAGGTVQDIRLMSPTSIIVLVGNADEPANGQYVTLKTTYGTGLITSFGAQGFPLNASSSFTSAADQNLNYEAVADKLETLAEKVGVLVARIDDQGVCTPILDRNASTPLATASIFKIWVLGAVAQAVEDGVITPAQTVPLAAKDLVGAGFINNEPLGTGFSVTDMAALMNGISDNTATDHLFNLVGRARNEAILSQFNFSTPNEMLPFLSMNETFHLFNTVPEAEALAYVSGTEQEQRDYLASTLEPLGPMTTPIRLNPVVTTASWRASAMDVCSAMGGLRKFNDASDAFKLIDQAYGADSFSFYRNKWERVWSKGGSFPDGTGFAVFTLGLMFESDSRGTFAVIVLTNNDTLGVNPINRAPVDSLISRLIDIVDEQN